MAESLFCSAKTITTLLISYTPKQNKKFKKIEKKYLGVNLTKYLLDLYSENYTMLIKAIKEYLNK